MPLSKIRMPILKMKARNHGNYLFFHGIAQTFSFVIMINFKLYKKLKTNQQ